MDRKESYKAQRRSYANEKKRVERELLSTFKGTFFSEDADVFVISLNSKQKNILFPELETLNFW